jgi:hypothetical protein
VRALPGGGVSPRLKSRVCAMNSVIYLFLGEGGDFGQKFVRGRIYNFE